jgi:hypothetical protein
MYSEVSVLALDDLGSEKPTERRYGMGKINSKRKGARGEREFAEEGGGILMAELIYLASPYSHPDPAMRELRYKQACEVAALLMRDGHLVYSPIAHSHPLTAYGLPANWDYWRRLDEEMIRRCDALAVLRLPGWEQSVGVQAELALARELGLKIGFVDRLAWSWSWDSAALKGVE